MAKQYTLSAADIEDITQEYEGKIKDGFPVGREYTQKAIAAFLQRINKKGLGILWNG